MLTDRTKVIFIHFHFLSCLQPPCTIQVPELQNLPSCLRTKMRKSGCCKEIRTQTIRSVLLPAVSNQYLRNNQNKWEESTQEPVQTISPPCHTNMTAITAKSRGPKGKKILPRMRYSCGLKPLFPTKASPKTGYKGLHGLHHYGKLAEHGCDGNDKEVTVFRG